MTTNLATKHDLQHFEQLMNLRFEAQDSRFSLMLLNLESRIVIKLGALMTVLFGVAGAALALVR